MRRIAENTKLQSQVQYHAEYERMKGTKIEIADDPELQRHLSNTKVQSQAQYHNEADRKAKQEANRPQMQMTSTLQQQQQQSEQGSSSPLLNEPSSPHCLGVPVVGEPVEVRFYGT